MFCAISGEAPEQPVVSLKSGHVFEKRLIEKYISENGKDPINNEEMTVDDLLEIKSTPETVKPRPPKLSSVPSILSALQDEWDSVMLESFTLKQQYQQVRQELSHALYQNDAATRVIARLKKERDAAREALANVQAHLGTAAATPAAAAEESMDVDANGLPEEVIEKMTKTSEELSQNRRSKKKPPVEFASIDSVKTYTQTSTIPSLHSSRSPGITAMDVSQNGNFILTGGNDKHVQIYNKAEDKVVANLAGHTKKVTAVKFRGLEEENDICLSAGADKHVRLWIPDEKKGYKLGHNINAHKSDVTGLDVHPTRDYFVSAGLDNKWNFYDFETAKPIVEVYNTEGETSYTSVSFHPDGMILGLGTSDAAVQIWDIKSQKVAATFGELTGKVNAIAFSENGYILATASEDNLVKLWDLRKLANTKTFTLDEGCKINSLAFDNYGQYLAIGGTDIRVLKAKDGSDIVTFNENTSEITGLHWSPLAQGLMSSSLDRTIRFYSAAN
ncbi:WD40-repeat-containing domain protein [Cokeromyces recurvatus]|uniref:WD40-repeat-containing domain protein n=1 Tax=Cokeromyces recurvatus TaxID=90255 RepID=UPI00221F3DFC|nr:WD40-repeat-containing domain protein [Cokeromyces recurvatus]KAI7903503.1 WD40-repeat-containing domain protein [Cokeromyces recurvatus]